MSFIAVLPGFIFTTWLLALIPGQGVAMVLRQSIVGGRAAVIWSVLGNSTGLVIWGLLSAFGLSLVFQNNPNAYEILKWSGVLFLTFLAVQTALQAKGEFGKFDFASGETQKGIGSAYRLGLMTNLTNVKAAIFAVAFLPVYVPKDFSLALGVSLLGATWAAVSMTWYLVMVYGVNKASVWVAKPSVRRGLTIASAVGLSGLAIGLALT